MEQRGRTYDARSEPSPGRPRGRGAMADSNDSDAGARWDSNELGQAVALTSSL